jgi:hypothetical protein
MALAHSSRAIAEAVEPLSPPSAGFANEAPIHASGEGHAQQAEEQRGDDEDEAAKEPKADHASRLC